MATQPYRTCTDKLDDDEKPLVVTKIRSNCLDSPAGVVLEQQPGEHPKAYIRKCVKKDQKLSSSTCIWNNVDSRA